MHNNDSARGCLVFIAAALALLFALTLQLAHAQQNTPPVVDQLTFQAPDPPAANVGVTYNGPRGSAQFCYWVIPHFTGGLGPAGQGACIDNVSTPLSASNPIIVQWGAVRDATQYTVLRQEDETELRRSCEDCLLTTTDAVGFTDDGTVIAGDYTQSGAVGSARATVQLDSLNFTSPRLEASRPFSPASLGTGTADANKVLKGDGTWGESSGGGGDATSIDGVDVDIAGFGQHDVLVGDAAGELVNRAIRTAIAASGLTSLRIPFTRGGQIKDSSDLVFDEDDRELQVPGVRPFNNGGYFLGDEDFVVDNSSWADGCFLYRDPGEGAFICHPDMEAIEFFGGPELRFDGTIAAFGGGDGSAAFSTNGTGNVRRFSDDSVGPEFRFQKWRSSAGGAAQNGDSIGILDWEFTNSDNDEVDAARFEATVDDNTAGTEDASMALSLIRDGTLEEAVTVDDSDLCFTDSEGVVSCIEPEGVFDAKAYGATGDGVTNDTTAIQAAIDACEADTPGGTVFFGTGTYLVDQLTVDAPCNLLGLGMDQTIFEADSDASQPLLKINMAATSEGMSFGGFTVDLDGDTAAPSRWGIDVTNVSRGSRFSDIKIIGGLDGIQVEGGADNNIFENLVILDSSRYGVNEGVAGGENVYRDVLIRSEDGNPMTAGFFLSGTSAETSGGTYFDEVKVIGSSGAIGTGFHFETTDTLKPIFLFGSQMITDGAVTLPVHLDGVQWFEITNSWFYSNSFSPALIHLDGASIGTITNSTISTCVGCGGAGILFDDDTDQVTVGLNQYENLSDLYEFGTVSPPTNLTLWDVAPPGMSYSDDDAEWLAAEDRIRRLPRVALLIDHTAGAAGSVRLTNVDTGDVRFIRTDGDNNIEFIDNAFGSNPIELKENGSMSPGTVSHANLPTSNVVAGDFIFCSDCTSSSSPCSDSGSGTMAFRIAGAWECPF